MNTPHIPTTTPAQLGDAMLDAGSMTVLHDGIRAAIVDEAMEWAGDFRTPVWMALLGAAHRMGILLTKDELYAEHFKRKGQEPDEPRNPEAPRHLWNGQRPAYTTTRSKSPQEQDHGQV